MSGDKKRIVVIGAGVIGLSTAIHVQETGKYKVTIVAETFPTDAPTSQYTSHWAGAHHLSRASGDAWTHALEKETFETMWQDSDPNGSKGTSSLFLRYEHTEFRTDGVDPTPWLSYLPDFQIDEDFGGDSTARYTMTTVSIDPPAYLNWLFARFLAGGGSIKRASLQHISQAVPERKKPVAIIACPGLGARSLGGIEDKDVYPIRGQTVLFHSPWLKVGRTLSDEKGIYAFMIPRPSGDVIVGVRPMPDDWHPTPRERDRIDILWAVAREFRDVLAPPPRYPRPQLARTAEDVAKYVVGEGCGLRPGRKGGIRLEVGLLKRGRRTIPVIYNYGHAGMGFQSSWGSARVALELLEGALETSEMRNVDSELDSE